MFLSASQSFKIFNLTRFTDLARAADSIQVLVSRLEEVCWQRGTWMQRPNSYGIVVPGHDWRTCWRLKCSTIDNKLIITREKKIPHAIVYTRFARFANDTPQQLPLWILGAWPSKSKETVKVASSTFFFSLSIGKRKMSSAPVMFIPSDVGPFVAIFLTWPDIGPDLARTCPSCTKLFNSDFHVKRQGEWVLVMPSIKSEDTDVLTGFTALVYLPIAHWALIAEHLDWTEGCVQLISLLFKVSVS